MRALLTRAFHRFPDQRQRESVAKSLLAFEANTGMEKAWQFKLKLPAGSDPVALAKLS